MIARLEGRLAEKSPEALVLDVGGVGYDVRVPLSTFFELPDEGKTVRLRIHTYVREAALVLYGFLTEEERSAFALLLGASGVGPRLALAILSGLPVSRLAVAVRQNDVFALVGIPGVGKKTAERIFVELADKIDRLTDVGPLEEADDAEAAAVSALVNLGYARSQAEGAVRTAVEQVTATAGLEELIREALRVAAR
jgi:Holliday junction DNA helicase RuvA